MKSSHTRANTLGCDTAGGGKPNWGGLEAGGQSVLLCLRFRSSSSSHSRRAGTRLVGGSGGKKSSNPRKRPKSHNAEPCSHAAPRLAGWFVPGRMQAAVQKGHSTLFFAPGSGCSEDVDVERNVEQVPSLLSAYGTARIGAGQRRRRSCLIAIAVPQMAAGGCGRSQKWEEKVPGPAGCTVVGSEPNPPCILSALLPGGWETLPPPAQGRRQPRGV